MPKKIPRPPGKSWCSRCRQFKPLAAFSVASNRRYSAYCKKCRNATNREYRLNAADRADTTAEQRFMAKIKKIRNGCWIWRGALNDSGQGLFTLHGRPVLAHVAACRIFGREVPRGDAPDGTEWVPYQTCGVPPCANYEHVRFCGRHEHAILHSRDNPFARNAKRDECPAHHLFTPENTHWGYRVGPRGGLFRTCVACRHARYPGSRLSANTPDEAQSQRVLDLTDLALTATKRVHAEIRDEVRAELVATLLGRKGLPGGDWLPRKVKELSRREWQMRSDPYGRSIDAPLNEDGGTLIDITPDRSIFGDPAALVQYALDEPDE
jgi:hypothetical protein